jgi:putative CocE/NonD family hydrolase
MRALLLQRVPTEGGATLATDVWLPAGPGPFPVVLVRTPYHRAGLAATAPRFVERGYAFVTQDCRGKFDSTGSFTPLQDEAADGLATLDWIANEPWCNGRVGMWGRSYLGIVQMPAAASGHEALRCIVPSVAPGSYFRDWLRYDGCFALANAIRWGLTHASCPTQPALTHVDWEALNHLDGPAAIAEQVGFATPALTDWVARDRYDDGWRRLDWDHLYPRVAIPGLHGGGWFDHLTRTQYESQVALPGEQRLLIGPWGHKTISTRGEGHTRYGDWSFGAAADVDVLGEELRFLDRHLRDVDDGLGDEPPVRVFLMGANRWLTATQWPPAEATMESWHLHAGGALSRETPAADGSDTFRYDPADPVPTLGGAIYWGLERTAGPVDVRSTMARDDVLRWRGEPLSAPMTVVGDTALDLSFATNVEDTDVIARLCVETPDGVVTCLTQGQVRTRFRDDPAEPTPLPAGTPVALRLSMGQTAYEFAAGSRIVLLITSSDFPRILPHRNRLAPLFEGDAFVATQQVLSGPSTPSCLHLPVIGG